MKPLLLAAALALPITALACPGKEGVAADTSEDADRVPVDADATRCAKRAELVGTACSYSTGMMAQRVHADGEDVTVTAKLVKATEKLPSKVAAPFIANDEYHVIANEVLDGVDPSKTHALTGKALEVDGITYLLVTGFQPKAS